MDDQAIQELNNRADRAEAEIERLFAAIENFRDRSETDAEPDGEIGKLATENSKLKYRINILKKSYQKKMNADNMVNIMHHLEELFMKALEVAFPDIPDKKPAIVPANPRFGDYQYEGAMAIAKMLKKPPPEVAKMIRLSVPESPLIEKMDQVGPYINVWLSKKFITEQASFLVTYGVRPPSGVARKRVVIDFSSPNIAKEMHVGHLRSTIIGDSIARLLEFLGHEVKRFNHVGDWGTQFGMLLAHLEDRFPKFATETPPIGDLQSFYKESKVRFDSDEEFKARAYARVVKLQAHDETYIKGWHAICDVSRREFQKIYDRLEVKLEERGESFYQDRMTAAVADLERSALLIADEGRKVMFADPERYPKLSVPLTVVKSDGGYTYDTSDMACIRQRIDEEKADWIIYVTDSGQAGHFQTIFACAERAGWLERTKTRVDHVGFGVVLDDKGKKFKSRSSETIRLVDLLDEGLRRAAEKISEREELKRQDGRDLLTPEEVDQARESIAYGCVKYADLSHNHNLDYIFSFDKMLEDKGNTAVYLLYAYTRIRSIIRTAGVDLRGLRRSVEADGMPLEHEKEFKLAKTLLRLPEVLVRVTDEQALHSLCDYLYEVSLHFTEFYQACYCIEKDRKTDEIVKVHYHRLALCEATAVTMAQCFSLLGINPVSRM